MNWNWQNPNWPHFSWDRGLITHLNDAFLQNCGKIVGATLFCNESAQQELLIEILTQDASDTSAIEGEFLNRASLQSSIKKALGLKVNKFNPTAAEFGIAELMTDLYQNNTTPLSEKVIFNWHKMIMNGRRDLDNIGAYRTHTAPMQIVSGPDYKRKIHFEAPPSSSVPQDMKKLIAWYKNEAQELSIIERAGIAHIWFETIHPFEDGNGRIGRAISEKILSESLDTPAIVGISIILLKKRKQYYQELSKINKSLDISEWLLWFATIVIQAQNNVLKYIEFLIAKTKLMDSVKNKINLRQEKLLLRLFKEGPEGFNGGLSAANYMAITGATIPTTTRDLRELVKLGVLNKCGMRKSTRYRLNIT